MPAVILIDFPNDKILDLVFIKGSDVEFMESATNYANGCATLK